MKSNYKIKKIRNCKGGDSDSSGGCAASWAASAPVVVDVEEARTGPYLRKVQAFDGMGIYYFEYENDSPKSVWLGCYLAMYFRKACGVWKIESSK